jgi:hypothetical protein
MRVFDGRGAEFGGVAAIVLYGRGIMYKLPRFEDKA